MYLRQEMPLSIFLHACIDGQYAIVVEELRRGVNVYEQDESGYDCLAIPELLGWRKISKLLKIEARKAPSPPFPHP
jgi:hypothetical protein